VPYPIFMVALRNAPGAYGLRVLYEPIVNWNTPYPIKKLEYESKLPYIRITSERDFYEPDYFDQLKK
jgi:hypothetical protein